MVDTHINSDHINDDISNSNACSKLNRNTIYVASAAVAPRGQPPYKSL